jgi:hypothetical protein
MAERPGGKTHACGQGVTHTAATAALSRQPQGCAGSSSGCSAPGASSSLAPGSMQHAAHDHHHHHQQQQQQLATCMLMHCTAVCIWGTWKASLVLHTPCWLLAVSLTVLPGTVPAAADLIMIMMAMTMLVCRRRSSLAARRRHWP